MLRPAAAALLLATLLLAPAVQADWPQFHRDARKTGTEPGTSYQAYRDLWWNVKLPGGATIETSPVVSDNVVIVGGSDKVLRAFDAASGAEKWNYTMTDRIATSPAIQDRLYVFAVDVKGTLVKLSLHEGPRSDGTPYAQVSIGPTLAPITLEEGKIFIGTEAGELKAFEIKSDQYSITTAWTFSVGAFYAELSPTTTAARCSHPAGAVRSAAAVNNGIVYFGAMNNYVYAINEQKKPDGTVRAQWFNATSDIVLASPTVDFANNNVYFASYDGKVRAFTMTSPTPASCLQTNRQPSWTATAPDNAQMRSSPATDGTRIYIGTNTGKVLALSTSGGTLLWNRGTDGTVVSSPAVSNGIVVVGSEDKNIYWLHASNGTVIKQFPAQSAIRSSPAIDGDRTFIASFDGTLYMFGPEIPKSPDLVVESIEQTDSGVRITVKNEGDAMSAATTVRVLLGGAFVANVALEAIEPGQSKSVEQDLDVEAAGTVKAIVDPDGTVRESAEANNEAEEAVAPPEPEVPEETDDEGGDGGDGGLKIPGPGVPLLLLGLAFLAALGRRRQA